MQYCWQLCDFEKSAHENIIGKKISFVECMLDFVCIVKVAKNTLTFMKKMSIAEKESSSERPAVKINVE